MPLPSVHSKPCCGCKAETMANGLLSDPYNCNCNCLDINLFLPKRIIKGRLKESHLIK